MPLRTGQDEQKVYFSKIQKYDSYSAGLFLLIHPGYLVLLINSNLIQVFCE